MVKIIKIRASIKKKKEELLNKGRYKSINIIKINKNDLTEKKPRRGVILRPRKMIKRRVFFNEKQNEKKERDDTFIEMSNLFESSDFPLVVDFEKIPDNAKIHVNKAKTRIFWNSKKYVLIKKNTNIFECLGMNFTFGEGDGESFNEYKNMVFYLNKNNSYNARKREYIKNGIKNDIPLIHDGPIMIEVVVKRGSRKNVRGRGGGVIKKKERFVISKNNKYLYFYEKNKIVRYDIVGGPAQYWSII